MTLHAYCIALARIGHTPLALRMPSTNNPAKIIISITFTVIVAVIAVTLGFGFEPGLVTLRTNILRPIQPALRGYSTGLASRLFSPAGISSALHSTCTASTAQSDDRSDRSMTSSTGYKRGEVYFLSHGVSVCQSMISTSGAEAGVLRRKKASFSTTTLFRGPRLESDLRVGLTSVER